MLVAEEDDVPPALRTDESVRVFAPVGGLHTALQAQCIRLLYPALLDAGGVLTADVDMVPLNEGYFHRPAGRVDERHFLAYRDALLPGGEIPICYTGARPQTWGDVFAVGGIDDVRERLREWGEGLRYDGVRGGHGWDTDQVVLYATLVARGRAHRDVWILDDRYTGHRRLVLQPDGWDALHEAAPDIARGAYSDFHLVLPQAANRELNSAVVDVAAGRRARA